MTKHEAQTIIRESRKYAIKMRLSRSKFTSYPHPGKPPYPNLIVMHALVIANFDIDELFNQNNPMFEYLSKRSK